MLTGFIFYHIKFKLISFSFWSGEGWGSSRHPCSHHGFGGPHRSLTIFDEFMMLCVSGLRWTEILLCDAFSREIWRRPMSRHIQEFSSGSSLQLIFFFSFQSMATLSRVQFSYPADWLIYQSFLLFAMWTKLLRLWLTRSPQKHFLVDDMFF